MPSQSKFLVIEGCNGVGKSTIVDYLCTRIGALSFHYPPEFVSFRRDLRLDECVKPLPRLTYYLAATMHLSDLVRDQLTRSHVICDRYLASPLSLMIGESVIEEKQALQMTEPFQSYLRIPDLTLLLTAEHAVVSERIRTRSAKSGVLTPIARRMIESKEFFQKREDACRRIATRLGPMVELDTTSLTFEEMGESVWSLVAPKLNWPLAATAAGK